MASNKAEFNKGTYSPQSGPSGKTRGVESSPSEDAALIGDTRMPLQYKPLPKLYGPNFGLNKDSLSDSDGFRVNGGGDAMDKM